VIRPVAKLKNSMEYLAAGRDPACCFTEPMK
jgi:hypothetical protein